MGTTRAEAQSHSREVRDRGPAPGGHSGIADALFSSTQQRLFALLFGQPERSFYARELIALAEAGSGAVQRELSRLVQSGLITVTPIGNQKHYQANPKSPVFPELRGIVLKSFGIADKIRQALLCLKSPIACAFIFGSVARGDAHVGSDIDIIIVSDDLSLGDVFAVLQPLETQLGRTISPTLYTTSEFAHRKQTNNPFLTKVLAGPVIPLLNNLQVNELTQARFAVD